MPQTLRSFFLAKTSRRYAKVEFPPGFLPEGMQPGVRSLTDKEKSLYEMEILKSKGKDQEARMEDARRRLVVITAVDLAVDGNPLIFEGLDVLALEDVDCLVTSAFYNGSTKHNGWNSGDIEDLVKNSGGTGEEEQP